ncbi:Hypothetical predicted protein, partial [Paramuricea clavata]
RRYKNKELSSSHENGNATQKSTVSSSYVVLPYIKGVTETITRTLQREKIRVSFQPTRTLQQEFPKPKDKLDTN